MQTLDIVGLNATEDMFDEAVSCFVNGTVSEAFGKKMSDDDCTDEAIKSALTTLEMGIKIYLVAFLTRHFYQRFEKVATTLFTYIIAGSAVNKLKSKITSKGLVGRSIGTLLGSAVQSREQKAKIAMEMVNQHERSIDTGIAQYQKNREYLTDTTLRQDSKNESKSIELFRLKSTTGTWTKTTKDKKIYEKATGYKLRVGESWSKLSQKLNQFQQFAKDTESNVINRAQVEFDTLTALQIEKLRH